MELDLSLYPQMRIANHDALEVRIAGATVWLRTPMITLASGTGYAGSVYHADQAGGQWYANGSPIPAATGQDWTMTLANEGAAIDYRAAGMASNVIQMWTPAFLASYEGVFDARQGLTMSGLSVGAWSPAHGAVSYSQVDPGEKPQYTPDGLDGSPAVLFDFNMTFDVANLPLAPIERTFVGFLRPRNTDPVNWTAIFNATDVGPWALQKRWAAGGVPAGVRTIGIMNAGLTNIQESAAVVVDMDAYIVAAKTARPAGNYGFRINGAAAGSGTSSVPAFTAAGSLYINGFGWLSSHVIADDYLSDDDIARIEGWLAHTLGQLALLPADHPYKNSAPTV